MTTSISTPTALDEKYRPKNLCDVIGNETVITGLRGIIKSKKFPPAIALFGPPSAGKTTLSRAFSSDVLGDLGVSSPDYQYVNVGDNRTIEDIRQLVSNSKLSPLGGVRRIIHLDECHAILSNAAAADCLLTPLEQPHPRMTWIISSMSPEKFTSSTKGKAILSRCQQYHLRPYSVEELNKQANRIIKGESMTFLTRELRDKIVENCGGQMRQLAHILSSVQSYYFGLDNPPEKLSTDFLQEVLVSSTEDDEKTAVRLLTAIHAKKLLAAQREILNVTDGFGIINKMMYMNWAVMNDSILKGERHPKIWMTIPAKALKDNLKKLGLTDDKGQASLVKVQTSLIDLKTRSMNFAVPEDQALFQFVASLM